MKLLKESFQWKEKQLKLDGKYSEDREWRLGMNIPFKILSFWSICTLLLPKGIYINQNDERVYKSTKTTLTVHTVYENLSYMYVVLIFFLMN